MRSAALAVGALLVCGVATAQPAPAARRSGFEEMGTALQAMQRDDAANPAMLWVQDGEQLWKRPAGGAPACSGCHGDLSAMKGVAARYPAFDERLQRPVDLATRIRLCIERHQQTPPPPPEHQDLLALEAAIATQSRGLPIAPPADPRLAPLRERGAALYAQRVGQLNLSCAQCHDQLAGGKLAGAPIPQGQASGYPLYRLEWQSLGSLGRRIRGCMTGVRAEPLAFGSVELAQLEAYLAARAAGMPLESPAVRP